MIVYFGGNDSMGPHSSGLGPHVPLQEYIENMRKIAIHLKVTFVGKSFFRIWRIFKAELQGVSHDLISLMRVLHYVPTFFLSLET